MPSERPPHPSLVEATRYWLLLGCISFGGPAGQIGLMHRELVERKRWIGEGRFLPGRLAGAISAAVVEVILHLGLTFATHLFWPKGFTAQPNWSASLIGAVALILLVRYDWGVLRLIGLAALTGLALHALTLIV